MDVELPDGTVVEGVPDGMSQRDLVALLSKNGHDTSWYKAPEPGKLDRIKAALTPDPAREAMPSTADTINEQWTSPKDQGISVPGSVMDGYIPPPANDTQGMPIDSGMGPMRKDYYDQTRAGLLAAPVQAHAAVAQGGGQVGKVAKATLPERADRITRQAAGDTIPRTQQELADDATGRTILPYEAGKDLARERLDLFKPQVIEEMQRVRGLAPEDAAAEFEAMRQYGIDPTDLLQGRREAGWGEVVANVVGSTPTRTENWMANFSRMVFDSLGATSASSDMASIAEETRKAMEKQSASIGRIPADSWKETFASALPSALDNLAGMTASVAATIATRNPAMLIGSMDAFVLAPMFAQKAGTSYEDGLKSGMPINKALTYGVAKGLSEVIPERLNFGILERAGQAAAKGIIRDSVIGYMKANGVEVAEEVITAVTDHMIDLGMKDPNKPIDELWKDVKQSALGVMMTMPLIMGGNAAAIGGYRLADMANQRIKESQDLTYGMRYSQDAIDAAARFALDPANAQLVQTGSVPAPVVPRATPADVANAPTPEAAAAAIADMGASLAPPAADSIVTTQAEIDALLADPVIDAAATPPVASPVIPPIVAPAPNIAEVAPNIPVATEASPTVPAMPDQAEPAPAGAQPTTGGQDGQGQKTAEVLTPPAAANPVSAAAADQESRLQEQYQKAQTEANDPRLTDGERKLAATKAEQALDALGEVTKGEAKSITRIKGGKLEISGYTKDDVADTLKTAKIKATVTVGKDGRVLVSAVDRTGAPVQITLRQQNAISKALTGASPTAKKPRGFTGNLRNDANLIAPGLYAEVARGGDGEGMAGFDMSLIAERLRDEGFMLPETETGKDSDAVIELIRQDIANGGGTLNEARATAALEEESAKKHRQDVLRMASEYGVETKRGIIPRRLEDVEADLEAAIEDELGVSGRGAMSAYEAAIAAGISEQDADAIIDRVAEGYTGDTARDAWVRQYRDQANALQEAIDAKEREGRTPEAEDAAETPGEAENRPALELSGQTEAEARAEEDRLARVEAERVKAEQDAERKRQADAELGDFRLTGSTSKADVLEAYGQSSLFGAPAIDAAANEAATSPTNDTPLPTPAQMEAGNYKKGHIQFHGFDISIENPKGSERVAKDGSWRVPSMPAHYGYIKGTVGADKDHLDVFVGPDTESAKAWIINQIVADSSPAKFDEHKVMLGFSSAEDAKRDYLDSFEGDYGSRVFGSMTEALTIEELKAKIEDGDLSRKKFAGPVTPQATGERATDLAPKDQPAAPVAESLAPEPSEPGDGGVATTQDGAAAADAKKSTPAEILAFAKGKTVTRQALVAETGQTVELKNQDAVEVLTELHRDIDALEALKLCIGA